MLDSDEIENKTISSLADSEIKNKRKINIALLLSFVAIFISIIQLLISSPQFSDYYFKEQLHVTNRNGIFLNSDKGTAMFHLGNYGRRTAHNVFLFIYHYDKNEIFIEPINSFTLIDSVDRYSLYGKTYIYSKNQLIPNETISVSLFVHVDSIKPRFEEGIFHGKEQSPYTMTDMPAVVELKSENSYAEFHYVGSFPFMEMELVKKEK